MMASPKVRGVGKNKSKWKEKDGDALVEVLKDLVSGGTAFKVDKGLKLRFLIIVAKKIKAKLRIKSKSSATCTFLTLTL